MTTLTEIASPYGFPRYAGQTMTKDEFICWESDDYFVYEFDNGILEPTQSTKQDEVFLHTNLENRFFQTTAFQQGDRMKAELDVWLTDRQMRRPDVAWYRADQLQAMTNGERVIPAFMIELSSEHDDAQKDLRKLQEYFQAGVEVVWWVYPELRLVYAYTTPKQVQIASGIDMLTAAPALPEFSLTVDELFAGR
jgi:Uma2 family endonuclease